MCEYLIEECDANQHKLDKNKNTPSQVARKLGHAEVHAYLDHRNAHIFDPYDPKNIETRY